VGYPIPDASAQARSDSATTSCRRQGQPDGDPHAGEAIDLTFRIVITI
jgi:hypothetical protein